MKEVKKTQDIQDEEYSFPYHYVSKHQGGFSQTYNWKFGISYESALEFLLSELEEIESESIVDVGTGDGRMVREINNKFPDKHVAGIDYSEKSINLAKAMNPGLDFRIRDILKEHPDKKYDIITLIEVFEHIPLELNYKFIEALYNILNEKGTLILTVPSTNKPLQKKHFQHFTADLLEKYFEKYFHTEKIIYFEKKNYLERILKLILSNKLFILKSHKLNNLIYNFYKKYCFFATPKNGGRIYMKLKKK